MGRILVYPDKLMSLASQIQQVSNQIQEMDSRLQRTYQSVRMESRVRADLDYRVSHARSMARRIASQQENVASKLKTKTQRFVEVDRQGGRIGAGMGAGAIRKFPGFVASVPPGVKLKGIGTCRPSTFKTNDKLNKENKSFVDSLLKTADKTLGVFDNLDKVKTLAHSALGLSFLGAGMVTINPRNGNNARAVIHTADWLKGKGNNETLKRLANKVNSTMNKVNNVTNKVPKNLHTWARNSIMGIDQAGMATKQLAKTITRRVFAPLDVGLNVAQESVNLAQKHRDGTVTKTDYAVAASNVAIKSAATYGFAIAGGAALSFLGPAGTAAGTFIGGAVGTVAGDVLAKGAEKGIRWVSGLFK